MNSAPPDPSDARQTRTEVFLEYLAYYRDVVVEKVEGLTDEELRSSRLPSGWTPLELVKHLTFVERRWLFWGFEGHPTADPWGDRKDGKWFVDPAESLDEVVRDFRAQAEISRAVVEGHELSEPGQPSERWGGDDPPTLERILFHLLQEYARHAGHLDIVRELIDGDTGE